MSNRSSRCLCALGLACLLPSFAQAQLQLVSVPAFADLSPSSGDSNRAQASADLQVVVFDSAASNLVEQDTNRRRDVFVRTNGGTQLISQSGAAPANGDSTDADISADGEWIVFSSTASNLVENDQNGVADLFLYQRSTAQLQRLSPPGLESNGASHSPRISASGQRIVFVTSATNWTASDLNGLDDIVVFDRQSQTATRASISWDGGQVTDSPPRNPQISPDGRCVSMESNSTQHDVADLNGSVDYFVFDTQGGSIARASLGTMNSEISSVTAGRHWLRSCSELIFHSPDSNVMPGTMATGYFLRQGSLLTWLPITGYSLFQPAAIAGSHNGRYLVVGIESPVSGLSTLQTRVDLDTLQIQDSSSDFGLPQAISDNGNQVISVSLSAVAPPDRNLLTDLLMRDRALDLQTWISAPDPMQSSLLVANGTSGIGAGSYDTATSGQLRRHQALSADGRYVLFSSLASNLVIGDTNGVEDVFLRDRLLNQTVRVSRHVLGQQTSLAAAATDLSADGRIALFESCDDLGVINSPTVCDLFARDMQTGAIEVINIGLGGSPANRGGSPSSGHWGRLSGDGRWVVFTSRASNLTPEQNTVSARIYLRDRQLGTTLFLGAGLRPAISQNGRYVVWTDFDRLMFLDRDQGPAVAIPYHLGNPTSDELSLDWPSVSDSGRYIAYTASMNGLVSGDQDNALDVFVFDRQQASNVLISSSDVVSNNATGGAVPSLSADGRLVAFLTDNLPNPSFVAGHLVSWQDGGHWTFAGVDVLEPERALVSRPRFSADGRFLTFAGSDFGRTTLDRTGAMFDVWVSPTAEPTLFRNGFE